MSLEQAWLEAWNSQDAGPKIELSDPDVEVIAVTLGTAGRSYSGHDGLREWMDDIRERFHARTISDAVARLAGEALLVTGTLFIADPLGGEARQDFGMVIHLRDGLAVWIGTFFSGADARKAYEDGVTGPSAG